MPRRRRSEEPAVQTEFGFYGEVSEVVQQQTSGFEHLRFPRAIRPHHGQLVAAVVQTGQHDVHCSASVS